VALHEIKQDRHEAYFQRKLNRKEQKTSQLRLELDDAQQQLKAMVRGTREAERQLRVDQEDVEVQKSQLSKTMGRQVAKMSHLWESLRDVKARCVLKTTKLRECNQVNCLIFVFACISC
jgi:ATP phosphoribosyltransferase regulatory subunit HisZ